ncbi:MAG: MCE family protein [Acetobacteraceae bacterium]|nr:MCE family protein [Acetobacteraceae bacterium]
MEGRALYLKVGLLIVAAIVVGLALVWFLSGGQVRKGELLETYFNESVEGLQVGSNVQYRGVTVGKVTQIAVVSAVYGRSEQDVNKPVYQEVMVRYVADMKKIGPFPSIESAVDDGLRAQLNSRLVTGLAYINLDFAKPSDYPPQHIPWQPEGAYVPSMPSAFTQVQNAGQQLLAQLDQVDVAKLVSSLTDLSENLDKELTAGDVHWMLGSATDLLTATQASVKAVDLAGLSADLKKTLASLQTVATNPDLRKLLSNGALATDQLATLTAQMGRLVQSLEATVRQAQTGTTALQAGLAPILRNLSATSSNLRDLAESLRQYPAQVLSGPPPRTNGPLR